MMCQNAHDVKLYSVLCSGAMVLCLWYTEVGYNKLCE